MRIVLKAINWIRGAIGYTLWYTLKYTIIAAFIFGINFFCPPSHWIALFDSEPLTNEEVTANAKEITVKWATEANSTMAPKTSSQLKSGTKVKVLARYEFTKDMRSAQVFNHTMNFLVELPNGTRQLAHLPEAAKLTRAVVKQTGDTINILDVQKSKRSDFYPYTFKTSDGKSHKINELNFMPIPLPVYYENAFELYALQLKPFEIAHDLYPKQSLAYIPTGFYKLKHTDYPLSGNLGGALTRGFSGIFDAIVLMFFTLMVYFIISRLLTLIPIFPNAFLKFVGGVTFFGIFGAYTIYVAGVSANLIFIIAALSLSITDTNNYIVFHRCSRCHHAFKLKYLGKELIDVNEETSEGTEHSTESRKIGEKITKERDLYSGYEREISRSDITQTRSTSVDYTTVKTTEVWEHRFHCNHCNRNSTHIVKKVKKDTYYGNTRKGNWH